jgi:S1-C subfamily serine protease
MATKSFFRAKTMGYLGSWLPTTVGVMATVVLVQNVALAKTAREVNQIAQAITVKIGSGDMNGSGVLLRKNRDVYTVLTAAHVVKEQVESQLVITTNDNQKHQVAKDSIRIYQGDVDLAIIMFRSSKSYHIAELGNSNQLQGGMDLYVAGFSVSILSITESVFTFKDGKVTAHGKRNLKYGYGLLYSNDTLPGMSGGPVLDETGQVVGIHGRGVRDQETRAKTGLNAGISIASFADIAGSLGVEAGISVARTVQNPSLTADDYFVAALKKYEQGDYQRAVVEFNQFITFKPSNALAYNNRGVLKDDKLNDIQGALSDYNQSIAIKPDLAEVYYNRGILKKDKLNDVQGSITDFRQATRLFKQQGKVQLSQYAINQLHLLGVTE